MSAILFIDVLATLAMLLRAADLTKSILWIPHEEHSMDHVLDNPVWHALTGPHAAFAIGNGRARHYELTAMIGVALRLGSALICRVVS